jgi:hypothetical protein
LLQKEEVPLLSDLPRKLLPSALLSKLVEAVEATVSPSVEVLVMSLVTLARVQLLVLLSLLDSVARKARACSELLEVMEEVVPTVSEVVALAQVRRVSLVLPPSTVLEEVSQWEELVVTLAFLAVLLLKM